MKKCIFILINIILSTSLSAQPFDLLIQLESSAGKIYSSKGFDHQSAVIAKRIEKAKIYYEQQLGFNPEISVLILSKADWNKFTSFPVYGMPHYSNKNKQLVLAIENNDLWKSFIPSRDAVSPQLYRQIEKVYSDQNGELSMQPFFDLLALHELGHAFHYQANINMQRKWMGELYVNILLHTWVAEEEPQSLPALTVFPKMVIALGSKDFKYTQLSDIENRYEEIGKLHAKNYGWFQCRWHYAAGEIYEMDGKNTGRKLWDALRTKNENIVTDEELAEFFDKTGSGALVRMMKNWND